MEKEKGVDMIIGIIGSEGTYDWKIHLEGKLFQSTPRGGAPRGWLKKFARGVNFPIIGDWGTYES